MTKKAKKKSIKTGYRSADEPRQTTVCVGYAGLYGGSIHRKILDENNDQPRITKSERKRLEKQRELEKVEQYNLENSTRASYPIDIWFLIGRFVAPEDVNVFSRICKDSFKVTCSRKFWLELYRRYVTDHRELPSHLQPNAVNTNVGLKTRVIRSLFYTYAPFVHDKVQRVPLADSPTELKRDLMVESHWWKRLVSVKSHIYVWRLHFKLAGVAKPSATYYRDSRLFSSSNLTELLHYNPEANSSLLQITAASFLNVPTNIFGMCVTKINVATSRNMKSHKVKLFFHEYRPHGNYNDSQATILTIDPVFDVQYLNWWHAEYPHPFDR